ncbi:porin [Rhodovulum marinum]|uniref:Outer membrane protein OmpU n=1 Tax=Rhodovulum marinum TaxID=320662 RepID=A0A4R2PVU6_9RHOB|nr:porin [Rhodovulum marinum]TCP40150.1 outer membrane protein OmpU [Rhodovulum marinum]
MKKVLLASTALAFSAGMAAAEITITGSAEMGIKGGDRYADTDPAVTEDKTRFHSDFTIKIVGSGETDNGLTFGMNVELDDAGDEDMNDGVNTDNEFVFISGNFGTLTLGETDGAFDKVMSEVALAGGSIADDETEHAGFSGNSGFDGFGLPADEDGDNQILRYDYAFGDFGFSASLEQENDGQDLVGDDSDMIYAIGVTWAGQFTGVEVGVGLGYTSWNDDADQGGDIWGISLTGDFGNGFQAGLNYSNFNADAADSDIEHWGVGVAYTMNAWTFAANYGDFDREVNAGDDTDGYGLLVNYDLGGGAVMQFGYGDGDDTESWSFGVAMSF